MEGNMVCEFFSNPTCVDERLFLFTQGRNLHTTILGLLSQQGPVRLSACENVVGQGARCFDQELVDNPDAGTVAVTTVGSKFRQVKALNSIAPDFSIVNSAADLACSDTGCDPTKHAPRRVHIRIRVPRKRPSILSDLSTCAKILKCKQAVEMRGKLRTMFSKMRLRASTYRRDGSS